MNASYGRARVGHRTSDIKHCIARDEAETYLQSTLNPNGDKWVFFQEIDEKSPRVTGVGSSCKALTN